jgi:hypothetical protein
MSFCTVNREVHAPLLPFTEEFLMKIPRGRNPNMRIASLNFDRDTWALVEEMAPNRKAIAHFLAHLVYAEHARRQERACKQSEFDDATAQQS